MVRKSRGTPQHYASIAQRTVAETAWFAQADASVADCEHWDIKPERLASAILLLLAKGRGIMFSLSWDQSEVRVTVYDGDHKAATKVADSIEFDDAMAMITEQASKLDKLPKRDWSETHKR